MQKFKLLAEKIMIRFLQTCLAINLSILIYLILFTAVLIPTTLTNTAFNKKHKVTVGISAFAIRHEKWECDKFLKSLNRLTNIHLAIVWDSFGSKDDCLLSILYDPRLKSIEIHLINEVCVRNGNCTKGSLLNGISRRRYEELLLSKNKKLFRKIRKYFKSIRLFLDTNLQSQTACYISPGLESNLGPRAAKVISKLAAQEIPQCLIVYNPIGGHTEDYRNRYVTFVESHGPTPGIQAPCIANLDGADINFKKRPSKKKSWMNPVSEGENLDRYMRTYGTMCIIAQLWTKESNCYDYDYPYPGDSFIYPMDRECKSGITYRLMAKQAKRAEKF